MNIAHAIDHTYLEPTATIAGVEKICTEASGYHFRAICIPPLFVKKARSFLNESPVKIATVVGFPFGYSAIEAKLAETVLALVDGADEIDLMINIAALKHADWQYMAKEINSILPVIRTKEKKIKVILETGLLTEQELITCCDIYGAAGVEMVKTSTGFNPKGATLETVKLLRKHLADVISINAGGNIESYRTAKAFLEAGAQMISTANGIGIVKEGILLQ